MLFSKNILDRIASGEVTVAFRKWRRSSPSPGSTLRTAVGVLSLDSVRVIEESDITENDARMSGAASRAELLSSLRQNGQLMRIEVRYLGDDPRALLREERIDQSDQSAEVLGRLRRLDERASVPWTRQRSDGLCKRRGASRRRSRELAPFPPCCDISTHGAAPGSAENAPMPFARLLSVLLSTAFTVAAAAPLLPSVARACDEHHEARTYSTRGVIRSFSADRRSVRIAHEAIAGFMDAMEMQFDTATPELVTALSVGDRVSFTFRPGENGPFVITAIARVSGN